MSHNPDHQPDPADLAKLQRERDLFRAKFLAAQRNYETKLRELSILKMLGDQLRNSSFRDRRTILTGQLEALLRYSPGLTAQLVLLQRSGGGVNLVADTSATPAAFSPRPHTLDPDLLAHLTGDKKPVYTKSADPGEANCLSVPLVHNSRTIGALLLHRAADESFTNNEVAFFSLAADQIATLIILYRVYDKMLHEEKSRHSLSRFFSQNITRQIMGEEDVRLGGRRADLAVMFADLNGFTALAEQLEQETVVALLNGFFSQTIPIVFENDGTLDKLLGDGFMAFFGAPIPAGDDTLRALTTACRLQKAVTACNAANRARGWPELQLSIGINKGEAVVGYVGSDQHLNYTVIGDNVNVAQRIQSLAEPGEILISRTVRDDVAGHLNKLPDVAELAPLPPLQVKGKSAPVHLFRVELADG